MAQQPVLPQATASIQEPNFARRWMGLFFTEDASPAQRPIADLQRRAVWIAIALLLQSGNEIQYMYMPYLGSFGSVVPFMLFLGSFYAIWMAVRPARKTEGTSRPQATVLRPQLWQRIVLIMTLLLTIGGVSLCIKTVITSFMAPQFTNDGTSLDTNAAILFTEGHNPYSDSNIPELFRRFSIIPQWTTPLREGQFANRIDYPTSAELQSALNTSLKAGDVPEFEGKVSYPALSFLTLVPFVLTNNYNVLPFYLLSYLLLIGLAWKFSRPEIRPWILLLSLANVPMWTSTSGGNLDIFYTLLVVLAWWMRNQRWSSAVFFGLALASKQIAWYFAPFYMIMLWRHYGFKEAVYRMMIAGSLGLAINLPFIMLNPHAWLSGVMAPISDPMFPMGVGLVNLSVTHLIPYLPSWVYSVLEYGSMVGAMAWYWRVCRKCPEAAILFGVVPLFFAWRSLSSYFYCVAFPIFIITSAKMKPISLRALALARLRRLSEQTSLITSAEA